MHVGVCTDGAAPPEVLSTLLKTRYFNDGELSWLEDRCQNPFPQGEVLMKNRVVLVCIGLGHPSVDVSLM